MPIYEYRCEKCGVVSDVKHAYKEQVELTCPNCGSHDLKRVFSAAGIVFKGSGFYVNDSRKSGGGGGSTTSPSGSTKKAESGGTAGESTPAAPVAAPAPSGGSGDAAA